MDLIRTLVVEDDPMVVEIHRQYIENVEGFTVLGAAETAADALRLVQELQPELVVLDVYLPDMDGLQTLQEIRRRQAPTDVILVTAARDAESIQEAFRYGAVDYIIKPFKFERIKNALENYRAVREKLKEKESLDQEEIDGLNVTKLRASESLPKGLTEITQKQVLLYVLNSPEPVSAEEVAEGIGLSRVTARRYLDHLEKSGKLLLEIQYGSVGRPVNRYRVKPV